MVFMYMLLMKLTNTPMLSALMDLNESKLSSNCFSRPWIVPWPIIAQIQ